MRKMSVQIREGIWGYRIIQGGNALDLRDVAFAAKIPVRKPGPARVDAGGPGEGGILVPVRVRMSSRPCSMPACRTGLADARILIIITALPARPAEE